MIDAPGGISEHLNRACQNPESVAIAGVASVVPRTRPVDAPVLRVVVKPDGKCRASAALGAEKPDRACFDAFLTRNALDPIRTLYIGNEYIADVVGAREAGLTPVLIDRNNRLPAADCWRIRELTDLIPPFSKRSSMPEQRSISR